METSREGILDILRRHDGASVEELAHELGLAGATIRRHLDVLMRDGYIAVSQVRGGAGRPRYAFSLTEAGTELFPHHYVRLTRRLVDEIVALAPGETEGRSGAQLARLIFEKMSDRIAHEYAPRVEGSTVEARVRSAAALLAVDGFDYEVTASPTEGVRLFGRGCPCSRFEAMAGVTAGAREHDRLLLEHVIGAPVVPLAASQVPADFGCGYRVG
jgi:predicted ArsR family transcriptional regulator